MIDEIPLLYSSIPFEHATLIQSITTNIGTTRISGEDKYTLQINGLLFPWNIQYLYSILSNKHTYFTIRPTSSEYCSETFNTCNIPELQQSFNNISCIPLCTLDTIQTQMYSGRTNPKILLTPIINQIYWNKIFTIDIGTRSTNI